MYLNLTTERSASLVSLSLLISDALIPPDVIQLSPLDVSTVPLISLINCSRSVQIEIKPSVRFSSSPVTEPESIIRETTQNTKTFTTFSQLF